MEKRETMKGLWLENGRLLLRDDITFPERLPGEALIRVRVAGICQTDLELEKGYYPFNGVPGHEFVGEVAAAPEQPSWEGKRVVGEINVVCGACFYCLNGRPNHCSNRSVLGIVEKNGALAEYLTLPLANLHLVPGNIPDDCAVFAEPLAAALQIQQQQEISPEDRVLVIGAGKLGQLIARTLHLTGCKLKVMARHSKQRRLLSQLGIEVVEEGTFPQRHFDVVVEACGTPDGLSVARLAVRPNGIIVLKSTYKGEVSLNLSDFVVNETTVIGSRCGPFAPAIRLMENGLVDPSSLISGTHTLNEGIDAFRAAAGPGVLKILVKTQ